jgi:predicted GTPase
LAAELKAMPDADVLVVELKAAAVDLAINVALERGMDITFCENRVVSTRRGRHVRGVALGTAEQAVQRFTPLSAAPGEVAR